MKKVGTRVLSGGMSGLVALSGVPMSALEVVAEDSMSIKHKIGDIIGNVADSSVYLVSPDENDKYYSLNDGVMSFREGTGLEVDVNTWVINPPEGETYTQNAEIYMGDEKISNEGVVILNTLDGISTDELDVVYDTVDGLYRVSLSDFCGSFVFKLDSSAPVLGDVAVTGNTDGKGWYNGNVSLKSSVGEDADSYYVKLNGVQLVDGVEMADGSVSAVIDTSTLPNGLNTAVLGVSDSIGNISEKSITFNVDNELPDVTITAENDYVLSDEKLVFSDSDNVKLVAKDTGSGFKNFKKESGEVISTNSEITIKASEISKVLVEDNLGNTKTFDLRETFGQYNEVLVDVKVPNISEVSLVDGYESNGKVWVTPESKVHIVASDDIKLNKVLVNGVELSGLSEGSLYGNYTLKDIGITTSGDYIVSAEDVLGKVVNTTLHIDIDTTNPAISDFDILGDYVIRDNKVFTKGRLKFTGNVIDTESGINSIEILLGDAVVHSGDLNYSIESSGNYSFRVTDNLGNVKTYTLGELKGVDVDGIVIDGDAPIIDRVSGFKPDAVSDGKEWYNSDREFTFSVSDSNIDTVEVIVNGEKVISEVSDDGTYSISIDADTLDKAEIIVKAVDKSGNISIDTYVGYFDSKELEFEVVSGQEPDNVVDGVDWYKEYKGITYKVNDENIKNIRISVNDKVFINKVNSDGLYNIPVDVLNGNVSIRVEADDHVGHTLDYTYNFMIDTLTPELKVLTDNEDLHQDGVDWYKSLNKVEFSVNEANINSIKTYINGKEVPSKYEDGIVSADTSKQTGVFDVKLVVEDNATNVSEVSHKFGVDNTAPDKPSGVLDSDYRLGLDGSLVYGNNPTVSLNSKDNTNGVGFGKFVFKLADGTEVDSKDGILNIKDSGEYYARVEDRLGNTTEFMPLSDLTGVESNNIIIDTGKPIIKAKRPEGDLDGWYREHQTFTADISDVVGIYNAKMTVNGVVVAEGNMKESMNFSASTGDVPKSQDNRYTVSVIVEDIAGNTNEWHDTVYIDIEKPVVNSGTVNKSYIDRGYGVFFKENPVFKVSASDVGIGLNGYFLKDSDGKEYFSANGEFTLGDNSYMVRAEDRLGNTSELVPFSELLGAKSNKVTVDGIKPVISCEKPLGVDGWFNSDVNLTAKVTDNKGIHSAKVIVNGVEVDTFTASESGVTSRDMKISTRGIKANSDGSYNMVISVEDNAGNTQSWTHTVYIDREAPIINKFVITSDGYKEGAEINGTGKYGFYIKGGTDVDIYVSDGQVSSGMDYVRYTLKYSDESEEKGTARISGGVAKVKLPENFKGFISGVAYDKVDNKSSVAEPDGIISETSNVHHNSSKVDITLPKTEHYDLSGNPLYNQGISIGADIEDSKSSIRKVEWGVGGETRGTLNISNDGKISGDTANVEKMDKNLVVDISKALSINDNANGLNVWVRVTDRVGHVSDNSRIVSIDKDAPIVNVSYDTTESDGYYNKTRVATVDITERNFKASDVKLSGKYGEFSGWSNVGGDTWRGTFVFASDDDYKWGIEYTDLAGNMAKGYESESFTIDKTAPVISVTWDNNSVHSGNFYNANRTATVTVNEHNFNPSSIDIIGDGRLSGWSSNGDTHTASVSFTEDGEYEFTIKGSDLAGNNSNSFESGKFIIDKKAPDVSISGVRDGVSYKKGLKFNVKLSDTYLDSERCEVIMTGRKNDVVKLNGSINEKEGYFSFDGFPDNIKYDDLYKLSIKLYDKAGNITEKNMDFSLNRYGSQYSFVNTKLLNTFVKVVDDIILEEISVDRLDVSKARVEVYKDGKEIEVPDYKVKISESGGVDSDWLYQYRVSKDVFQEDGKYSVMVYSQAYNGDTNSSISQEYSFVVDNTKPEVIISGVENGKTYKDVSRKVTVEARDLSGIKSVKAYVDGKEVTISQDEDVYSLTMKESNNRQSLKVVVTDTVGSESVVEVKDILITTNTFVSLANSPIFKGVIGVMGVGVVAVIGALGFRRRKKLQDEREVASKNARIYRDSGSGKNTTDEEQ